MWAFSRSFFFLVRSRYTYLPINDVLRKRRMMNTIVIFPKTSPAIFFIFIKINLMHMHTIINLMQCKHHICQAYLLFILPYLGLISAVTKCRGAVSTEAYLCKTWPWKSADCFRFAAAAAHSLHSSEGKKLPICRGVIIAFAVLGQTVNGS